MSKINLSATLADPSPSHMLGAWPKSTSILLFPSGSDVSSWWTGFITSRLFEATQISVGCLTQASAATRGWSSAPGSLAGNRCVFCLMVVHERMAFYGKFRYWLKNVDGTGSWTISCSPGSLALVKGS